VKAFAASILTCLVTLACTSTGPSLGPVRDVTITETGPKDDATNSSCRNFAFTPRQIRSLLQRAVIITRVEEHHSYSIGRCYVRGTATFRGRRGTWVFGEGGTGTIVLFEDVEFIFADPNISTSDG
jgi:hypothetical protein